jgi:Spy/CpxP family protein refolding chaperone
MKHFFSLITLSSTLLAATTAVFAIPANSTTPASSSSVVETDASAPLVQPKGAWLGFLLDSWREVRELRSEYPLSAEQKTAIKTILANYHDDIVLQLEARVKAQKALHAEVISPTSDEASVRAAAQQLGGVIADGAVLRSKIAHEIRPLLTEEQRTALARLLSDLESRAEGLLAVTMQ